MTDTIHSQKTPQPSEQNTFVTIGKVPEDEQITLTDTGWSLKPVLDSMVQWVNNYRELQKIAD